MKCKCKILSTISTRKRAKNRDEKKATFSEVALLAVALVEEYNYSKYSVNHPFL